MIGIAKKKLFKKIEKMIQSLLKVRISPLRYVSVTRYVYLSLTQAAFLFNAYCRGWAN